MQKRIVEGEPGIFPANIARLYQRLFGWLRGKKRRSDGPEEQVSGEPPPS